MNIFRGKSSLKNPERAVQEVFAQYENPTLLLFFAPVSFFRQAAQLIYTTFPNAVSIGTTSHYVYSDDGVETETFSVFGFDNAIDCSAGIIEEITRFPMKYAPRVTEAFHRLKETQNTVCLEFSTAFSLSEDLVLSALTSVCAEFNIPVAGGTAGMSPEELHSGNQTSYVALNGRVYENAAAFVFLHNHCGKIRIYKENIYKPSDKMVTVTSVDTQNCIVNEFDNKPASLALAEALHCTQQELPHLLSIHQLGKFSGKELFISSFNRVLEDGSVSYNSRIFNHTKLAILDLDDYRAVTEKTVATIRADTPEPSFVFLIHCQGRTMFFEQEEYLQNFAQLYSSQLKHIVGFSSIGEQLNKLHFNHTLLALVFE